jgi:hypothetical protein
MTAGFFDSGPDGQEYSGIGGQEDPKIGPGTYIALIVVVLVFLAAVVGAIGGSHKSSATSFEFTGKTSVAAQEAIIGEVQSCGVLTHTVTTFGYRTPPLAVTNFTLGSAMAVPSATLLPLEQCMLLKFQKAGLGVTVQLCPAQAGSVGGDTAEKTGSFIAALITCATAEDTTS